MSKMGAWIPLVVALILNAAANVLLKVGAATATAATAATAATPSGAGGLAARAGGFLNAVTIVAIALFGLNVLFYRKALEGVPLSVGYPVMLSGSLVLAVVASSLLPGLHERLNGVQVGGMAVIVVGVWMVTRT
jgi:multidrug transporter EmrE-like cation transporter